MCSRLDGNDGVTNLVVLPGAARKPPGDVVLCDVTREVANEVLDVLDTLGIDDAGSITVERIELLLSDTAQRISHGSAESDDAVVWEEFAQRMAESSRLTWSFLAFLTIATLIAAIGILNDSPILIVGAMVLGPEFGPISAISFGLLTRTFGRVGRASMTLVGGFLFAILTAFLGALVCHQLGWIDSSWVADRHRETQYIVHPDRWSFIAAVLAGVAGTLSLTSEKSSVLVGVFISVTTVPAAAYMALTLALAQIPAFAQASLQLGLNITGMIMSGFATLVVLWLSWGSAGLRFRAARSHAISR